MRIKLTAFFIGFCIAYLGWKVWHKGGLKKIYFFLDIIWGFSMLFLYVYRPSGRRMVQIRIFMTPPYVGIAMKKGTTNRNFF